MISASHKLAGSIWDGSDPSDLGGDLSGCCHRRMSLSKASDIRYNKCLLSIALEETAVSGETAIFPPLLRALLHMGRKDGNERIKQIR